MVNWTKTRVCSCCCLGLTFNNKVSTLVCGSFGVWVFGWSLVVTGTSNFKFETTTGRFELVLLGFESLERVEFKTNGFRRNKSN